MTVMISHKFTKILSLSKNDMPDRRPWYASLETHLRPTCPIEDRNDRESLQYSNINKRKVDAHKPNIVKFRALMSSSRTPSPDSNSVS